MGGIQPYKQALAAAETKLKLALASGREGTFTISRLRVGCEIMADQLRRAPESVLQFDRLGPDLKYGFKGPQRWWLECREKADLEVNPQYGSSEKYVDKHLEYINFADKIRQWGRIPQQLIVAKEVGKQYLIFGAHPLVPRIMELLSNELLAWFRAQPNMAMLIDRPAERGFATMLTERPDLEAALRIAQTLPPDMEVSGIPVDRPAMVEAVEFAIGLIPVVGNVVAGYEAWSGEDLFGYKLSDLERGILGASVLLPAAGRLFKGGRALYTEARLVSLYGHDAAAWSKAIGASGRGMAERQALDIVEQAGRALRAEKSVTGALAGQAAKAVPKLVKGGSAASTAVDQAIADLLRSLHSAHPQLAGLDAFSLERVLAKGPNPSHLKGQLLEELIESRLVPWLGTREGGFALGIAVPAGKKLEFIPGHLIRDTAGRQISDGMLVYREGDALIVGAVFEAKAGKSAARELSLKRASLSSLTDAERAELRANAKDVWREQRDVAKAAGTPFKKSIEDVEKEYALSELGGQVRRDVERLADSGSGPARVRIGTQEFAVRLSPTKTKFFGILPRDVRASTIEAQLKESGFAYEILGVDMTSKALDEIAASLKPMAETLAQVAP